MTETACPSVRSSSFRGVVFDLMDTLAFLEPGAYENIRGSLAKMCGVPRDRFDACWAATRRSAGVGEFPTIAARFWRVLEALDVQQNFSSVDVEAMSEHECEMWLSKTQLYPDTIVSLRRIREMGLKMAILSNGSMAMKGLPERLGLAHAVDAVIFSFEAGAVKPEPRSYACALEAVMLPAESCLYVGDGNDHELDGALSTGMFTVKIRRSSRSIV